MTRPRSEGALPAPRSCPRAPARRRSQHASLALGVAVEHDRTDGHGAEQRTAVANGSAGEQRQAVPMTASRSAPLSVPDGGAAPARRLAPPMMTAAKTGNTQREPGVRLGGADEREVQHRGGAGQQRRR